MINEYLKYFLAAIILFLMQKTFIPLINIEMVTPDLPILLVVFIAIRRGQIHGMVSGFAYGLLIDIFSSSFLGLNSLSYLIAGFIAGYFYEENRSKEIYQSYLFIFIMFLCIFISNMIYFAIFVQGMTELSYGFLVLKYCVGSTVYSLVFGVIFMFILSRGRINLRREV
jgi:rod shape-determining protein MreD